MSDTAKPSGAWISAEREMTLKEWMARLPATHTANIELAALERDLDEARRSDVAQAIRASEAEAAIAALREQRCETCRHQDKSTWPEECKLTRACEDSYREECATFNYGCLAWERREP